MSKGDSPRPHDRAKFREEYDRIFKKRAAYAAPEEAKELLDEHTRLWADEYARRYKTYPARVRRLVRNAARCRDCGTLLESKHRHDYQRCPCGNSVDGGLDYVRRGFMHVDSLEDLCEYEEDTTREEG